MNHRKLIYGIISIILTLSFISVAAGLPSWFDESRLPTPRWTLTPRPTVTIPFNPTTIFPTTIPTTLPTVTATPTHDGTSWFDESLLPASRWTLTPRPTVTFPSGRPIIIPTTKPTPAPTTVPTATTTPTNEKPWAACRELTVVTWTGDYEYAVAGANVYILLNGCPPSQYCKEDYNYFLVGTTDINGKLILDPATNSNMFRAVSPQYSNYGNIWHFVGTAETDPETCGCRVDIGLDEKIVDAVATPTPVWTRDPDSILTPFIASYAIARPLTIKIWTADGQYTVPGAKLFYYSYDGYCPPDQPGTLADNECCYCHCGTADMEGIAGNLGSYAESPLYSRPGEGSWYYSGTREEWYSSSAKPYIFLDKKVVYST